MNFEGITRVTIKFEKILCKQSLLWQQCPPQQIRKRLFKLSLMTHSKIVCEVNN